MNECNEANLNSENTAETLTVEECFGKLDSMLKRMESSEITLEESFRLYQEGMELLKNVNSKIDTYEKKMQILIGEGKTEEFT